MADEPAPPTVVVPAVTVAAPLLAWADDPDEPGPECEPVSESWGLVWSNAGVLLVCSAVAVIVVCVVGWAGLSRGDGRPVAVQAVQETVAPSSVTSPAPWWPVDARFVSELNARGVPYRTPESAVTAAKAVCGAVKSGRSRADVLASLWQANKDKTAAQLAVFVDLAVQTYCPLNDK